MKAVVAVTEEVARAGRELQAMKIDNAMAQANSQFPGIRYFTTKHSWSNGVCSGVGGNLPDENLQ